MERGGRGRTLVWFRRDLRDFDHAALHDALAGSREVYCTFVFDRDILDRLPSRRDRRVEFIHDSVRELDAALRARGRRVGPRRPRRRLARVQGPGHFRRRRNPRAERRSVPRVHALQGGLAAGPCAA